MTKFWKMLIGSWGMHIANDPSCKVYRALEEDLVHILRDCPLARFVWNNLGIRSSMASNWLLLLQNWVFENLTIEAPSSSMALDWPMRFAVTSWWLWHWRNARVFNNEGTIPINPINFLLNRLGENSIALLLAELLFGEPKHLKLEKLIKWEPPRNGWLLLNIDCASKSNLGQMGGGGIIRDHRSLMLSAFMENYGYCLSPKAELIWHFLAGCV